jgi:TPP-dependent pyruvate/acetoin dehydrogenase alpha subunit
MSTMTNEHPQLGLFRSMLRIRMIEEAIADRYAEQEMRCPVHLSIGQEAAVVGACSALRKTDKVVTTHRCHGHYLAKGGDLRRMMAEIYGRDAGCCGGRGGSMHLFDDDAGIAVSQPIVGSSIPVGVGIALAFQQAQKNDVAMICLGDAATEEGVFHESLNFAALKKLPAVFFVENNYFSVYTHLSDRQPVRPISNMALGHGMASAQVDGNDVLAVQEAVTAAVTRARAGEGPSLIVADTYRFREHCGPLFDDDLGYRSPEEVDHWKQREPLERFRQDLRSRNIIDAAFEEALTATIQAEIQDAFDFAINAPAPSPASLGEYIYAQSA